MLKRVMERTEIDDRYEAERTLHAVLQTLCDRLTGDEADDLLAQLPHEVKTAVTITTAARPMSADEFVALAAERMKVDPERARRRIRAVFGVLREAVTLGEFDDVLAQLDPEYADLIA